jgi:excisionase family DNA binding protein
MIARQAAQEAFEVFKSSLQAQGVGPACECSVEHESHGKAERGCSSPVLDERFLSVREAATRLNVSEKTVRRKIQVGDLPARRFGKLLRIRERDLILRLSVGRLEVADDK